MPLNIAIAFAKAQLLSQYSISGKKMAYMPLLVAGKQQE
jgi:hypothetical protein